MNRLTGRMENNDPYYPHCYESNCDSNCATCDFDYEVLEKLTAYEDLEEKLEKVYGECDGLLEVVVNGLVNHEGAEIGKPKKARLLTDEDVDKWEDLKNAEEQGLLLRLPAPLDGVESFKIVDKGIWLNVPCQIGDTVYVICECETIPPQLDGTLYGENGEPGTATGYYCPYEENCPHVGKACEDDFDCDKFKGKPAVFEDSVIAVWHDESGVSIITSNCPINSRLGEYVFFTKEEAEQALARMEGNNG